ncbi:MAG TPA: hypothetical protein VF635_16785, partial [Propionibacteriaceae bacterium]
MHTPLWVRAAMSAVLVLLASVAVPTASSASTTADQRAVHPQERAALFAKVEAGQGYASLSAREKFVFSQTLLPVRSQESTTLTRVSPAVVPSPTALADPRATCWSYTKRWGWKAAAGNTVYTIWLGSTWCSSGGRITDTVYTRGGETSTPGWRHLGSGGGGYRGLGSELRRFIRERFRLEVLGYTVQEPSPCG